MWEKIIFLLLFQFSAVCPSDDQSRKNNVSLSNNDNFKVNETVSWDDFMRKALWTTDQLTHIFLPHMVNTLSSLNISELCSKSILLYVEGMKNWEPWAMKMVDASAKIPSGILSGTATDFGSLEACLQARTKLKNELGILKGKFCMVEYKSHLFSTITKKFENGKSYLEEYGHLAEWASDVIVKHEKYLIYSGLRLGTCMPSTCTEQDIRNICYTVSRTWASEVIVSDCQVDEPKRWMNSTIIAICFLLSLIGVCLIGTAIDLKKGCNLEKGNKYSSKGVFKKLFMAFSLPANAQKLFDTNGNKGPLECLNGIRFFLSLWVLFFHVITSSLVNRGKVHNSIYTYPRNFIVYFALIDQGFAVMQCFFIISGFLMVFNMKNKLERNGGKLYVIEFFIQKYFRLIPAYIFAISLYFLIPIMNSGPFWESTWEQVRNSCQTSGWKNLLFIHNFETQRQCLRHLWFIACLIQIEVVCLLLMIVIYRLPKTGTIIGALLSGTCITLVYNVVLIYKVPNSSITWLSMDKYRVYYRNIHIMPYSYFPSFLAGMIVCWSFLKFKDNILPKIFVIIGWTLWVALCIFGIYSPYIEKTVPEIDAIYYAFRGVPWILSFSWLVYACITGNAGILNRCLSFKAYRPFARISYCVYVLHMFVLTYRTASTKERISTSMDNMVFEVCGIYLITCILSFFACIAVETPFRNLHEMLIKNTYSLPKLRKD